MDTLESGEPVKTEAYAFIIGGPDDGNTFQIVNPNEGAKPPMMIHDEEHDATYLLMTELEDWMALEPKHWGHGLYYLYAPYAEEATDCGV